MNYGKIVAFVVSLTCWLSVIALAFEFTLGRLPVNAPAVAGFVFFIITALFSSVILSEAKPKNV